MWDNLAEPITSSQASVLPPHLFILLYTPQEESRTVPEPLPMGKKWKLPKNPLRGHKLNELWCRHRRGQFPKIISALCAHMKKTQRYISR